jgi:hypothetical protein
MDDAVAIDKQVLGETLAGTDRPLVIASVLGLVPAAKPGLLITSTIWVSKAGRRALNACPRTG